MVDQLLKVMSVQHYIEKHCGWLITESAGAPSPWLITLRRGFSICNCLGAHTYSIPQCCVLLVPHAGVLPHFALLASPAKSVNYASALLASNSAPLTNSFGYHHTSCCRAVSVLPRLSIAVIAAEAGVPAVPAACGARRWLERYAAGVKLIRSQTEAAASACTILVSCLPALEDVALCLPASLDPEDLSSLLEALACCPRLRALDLALSDVERKDVPHPLMSGCAPAFAQLRSLTKLALSFGKATPPILGNVPGCDFDDVVDALVPLTSLTELRVRLPWLGYIPAKLGQLKGLHSMQLTDLDPCVLGAGCFDLPNLQSLEFCFCDITVEDAEDQVLQSLTALKSLTRIEFSGGNGPPFVAGLVQLPKLQRMVFQTRDPCDSEEFGDFSELSRLPAEMGPLDSALLHLDYSGHGLAEFPLGLTQLVALECLRVSGNNFEALPAAITALSRLTELSVGRIVPWKDPLQLHEKRPLDVRALGDLSGLPALCELSFDTCEVRFCESVLGTVRHASLASLCFSVAHPAPECVPVVLQLSQALGRLRLRSVLRFEHKEGHGLFDKALRRYAQGQAPFQKFKAEYEACAP